MKLNNFILSVRKYMLVIFLSLAGVSCNLKCEPNAPFIVTSFPTTPVNMGPTINSAYDDYNSTSNAMGETAPLCFSSNRNSKGNNFDIIYKLLTIYSIKGNSNLQVGEDTTTLSDFYQNNVDINDALKIINSQYDELGPYLMSSPQGNYGRIFLYASNDKGNFNIKLITNINSSQYSQPQEVSYLNSSSDDLYPSVSRYYSHLYFCSNRGGDFDIYKVVLDTTRNILQNLQDTSSKVIFRDTTLSYPGYDDKCPFIVGNVMVFASNRPGGYGGFDLYYSLFSNGKWSSPVNFGNKINTPYDEYRPIIKEVEGFTNDFMIFSSNRPGGFGGFDLYYVGINKMINWSAPAE